MGDPQRTVYRMVNNINILQSDGLIRVCSLTSKMELTKIPKFGKVLRIMTQHSYFLLTNNVIKF